MDIAETMDMDRGVWHVAVTNKPLKKKVNGGCGGVCVFENVVRAGQGPECRMIGS